MKEVRLEEVVKGLFVGPVQAAYKRRELANAGVTHILDCGCQKYLRDTSLFSYLVVAIDDDPDDEACADLLRVLPETDQFISEGRKSGGILVHCKAGASRSVSIVIAYLIRHEHLEFDEALRLVQKARSRANPNDGFRRVLQRYATEQHG
mmetsp:Transcript_37845/g.88486  ORF Transcript_37845/g.88486 Transcript_37845/m.88486 type:complete len:150 (-) Transcript_37845:202-651(-)